MARVLLAALLIFVAGRCLVPMDETDLFFNLRLGEIILARHAVPRTNLLSFTYPEFRDVNLAWLFQIILVLAYRAGGIAGTVVLKTAFVLATWTLLFRVALRRGAHPAAAAAALALAAWAAEPRFVERPHLVTFLGLGVLLLALARAEGGRPRLLWAMIPLALIWANGNSCFFLAPCVLALYAVGARLDGRARRCAAGRPGSRWRWSRSSSRRRRASTRWGTSRTTGACPGCARCRSTGPPPGRSTGRSCSSPPGLAAGGGAAEPRVSARAARDRAGPAGRAAHPLRRRVRDPERPDRRRGPHGRRQASRRRG